MGMEMSGSGGMSPAEAILVSDRNRGYDDGFGGGGYWMMFLFFLLAWGNGGWGGNGWGNNGALQGALTRADLCQDMNFTQLENGVRGIQQGLCDGFYAQNNTMLQISNGLQRDLCSGFSGVASAVAENRFASQQCCCETNRNIDAVRYENARNTCDIVTAIKEDGAATRAMMTQNVIQDLRDRLEDRDRAILARDNQLSQQAQNAYLVDQLRPCPIPAYLTCSPYYSYYPQNNGCGCGNGFGGCCN